MITTLEHRHPGYSAAAGPVPKRVSLSSFSSFAAHHHLLLAGLLRCSAAESVCRHPARGPRPRRPRGFKFVSLLVARSGSKLATEEVDESSTVRSTKPELADSSESDSANSSSSAKVPEVLSTASGCGCVTELSTPTYSIRSPAGDRMAAARTCAVVSNRSESVPPRFSERARSDCTDGASAVVSIWRMCVARNNPWMDSPMIRLRSQDKADPRAFVIISYWESRNDHLNGAPPPLHQSLESWGIRCVYRDPSRPLGNYGVEIQTSRTVIGKAPMFKGLNRFGFSAPPLRNGRAGAGYVCHGWMSEPAEQNHDFVLDEQ